LPADAQPYLDVSAGFKLIDYAGSSFSYNANVSLGAIVSPITLPYSV
jgi:hypothetical protein